MRYEGVNESDWKTLRKHLPEWQEEFMARLCREYAALLSNEEMLPSARLWALDERIQKDKELSGVSVQMSRSRMYLIIQNLLMEDVITLNDLTGFSAELQDHMRRFMEPVENE